MYKPTNQELDILFNAIKLDYIIDLDKVINQAQYESVIVNGTVEIDIFVTVTLDHKDQEIKLHDVTLDIIVFDEREPIKYDTTDLNHYLNLVEKLENDIKSILNN